ncbi:MAG: vitamin B12-dependent ribonucleotide reductase [Endomicrobium sp.]|jgi:ribonucleoside-diphosphate reductase alpha chain|nr:vitamin B12-dependent ribonucleotide reductase [Endomicrobium sp.]
MDYRLNKKNVQMVLKKRYLKKDVNGTVIETVDDLFHRVAKCVAEADKIYDKSANILEIENKFYILMSSLDFLPNSPTLMNAGKKHQQLSACFVLPIEDSMDSIFETLKNTAMIHKLGGGTGFSFSNLRPKNDIVNTTNGVSSGPVSFMQVFDAATEAIKQGGVRRGANMGILKIDHPDILDFITCKESNSSLNNFNISVAITEKFMQALKHDEYYGLYNPKNGKLIKKLNAKKVFDKIVAQAWKNGEPGIIFIDRINNKNTIPALGKIEATNPCGEQPLLPYESCNLGSINVSNFIKNNEIDWNRLESVIIDSIHFLDNIIDINKYPMKEIKEMTISNRKIGLGIMGWADLLISLGIPYGSEKSIILARKLMSFIQLKSHESSEKLASIRGVFPNFKHSIYAKLKPMRNATTTTIAPTGTISMIASASSGIEPIFSVVYKRKNCLDNEDIFEINQQFEKIAKDNGFYSIEILNEIAEKGSIQKIKNIPERIKNIFVTAHDIDPKSHIKMQATFQMFTDNAISKTVNFPNYATKKDIEKAYVYSYEMGCKGITVYRDKSRHTQVLNIIGKINNKKDLHEIKPRIRPKKTNGYTISMNTGCGNMYVTINEDKIGICEVFTQLGKSGGCTSSQSEAISRLVSLALRSGITKTAIIKQLIGIRCPIPALSKGGTVLSCADAVAKALITYEKDNKIMLSIEKSYEQNIPEIKNIKNEYKNFSDICPQCKECGEMLTFSEGCVICKNCGYSVCT